MCEIHSGRKLMYTPHPVGNGLGIAKPAELTDALKHTRTIQYATLLEMHSVIVNIAEFVLQYDPQFVPVFATGAVAVMFPVMDYLAQCGHTDFVDDKVFHLFPGLGWSGKIDDMASQPFFVEEAVPILKRLSIENKIVRVLAVDVTYSGNAINKMVKALDAACAAADISNVELHYIGLIDGKSAKPAGARGTNAVIMVGEREIGISTPGDYVYNMQLLDRQVKCFHHEELHSQAIDIEYWVPDDIFTEDEAQLVGAIRIKDELAIRSSDAPGTLRVLFDNGRDSRSYGYSTAAMQIYNILSGLNTIAWDSYEKTNELPESEPDQEYESALEWFHTSNQRIMELDRNSELGLEQFADKGYRLIGADIYWLVSRGRILQELVPKVVVAMKMASGEDNDGVTYTALDYLRQANPDIAKTEPTDAGQHALREWWMEQYDSMKRQSGR